MNESQIHNMDVSQVDLPVATATVKHSAFLASEWYKKSQDLQLLLLSDQGHSAKTGKLRKCLAPTQSMPEQIVQES